MEAGNSQVSKMNIILKVEGKVVINTLTNPTLNATGVISLVTTVLNVTPSCLVTEKGEKSNFTEEKEKETLLMAFHVKESELESDIWYLDTCCNNHMCVSKSFFSHLNEDFPSTMSFGDHSK